MDRETATRPRFGAPLDVDRAVALLQQSAVTPFNIKALRILVDRYTARAEAYNETLLVADPRGVKRRWALWAAALNAVRRLERAVGGKEG